MFVTEIVKNIKLSLIRRVLRKTELILVVSTGRTGTKFFESFLKKIFPKSPVFHEPKPDLFDISIKKIRFGVSEEKLKNEILFHRTQLFYDNYSFLEIIPLVFFRKSVYVESNPFVFPILNEFSSLFKNVKIIYVSRDFKTYSVSAYNMSPQGDGISNFYGMADRRERLTAVDFGEMSKRQWDFLSRMEKIAWYWNKCNKILYTELPKKNSIHMKFENLFSEDPLVQKSELERIMSFLEKYNIDVLEFDELMNNKINKSNPSGVDRITNFEEKNSVLVFKLTDEMRKNLNY
ncbi:hypothetical protein APR41_12015 [Salegentibacter salinarum]|uniref:Sulfotransferase domain-containing protein n=1 Tax=Salegentibacter salinarum TaxID=447422 RepID=A0A2N0U2B3_9FLAO|nr:sulfotransferase domain-containing protein [Salegentibacter salinarum]PKD21134.1 hypothetical protein APR41_12015 [Salegentibacter salinarum]